MLSVGKILQTMNSGHPETDCFQRQAGIIEKNCKYQTDKAVRGGIALLFYKYFNLVFSN